MKQLLSVVAAGLLLSACGQTSPTTCAGQDAQNVISQIVLDEIGKATRTALGSGGDVTEVKIKAAVDQLKVAIEDIRTVREDDSSTKRFCAGAMKVTIPAGMLADAEKARELVNVEAITPLMQAAGFERSADTFSRDLPFEVQPTDDGQKIYGQIEAGRFSAVGEILASHLLRAGIEAQKEAADAAARAQEAELAAQAQAQNQAELSVAEEENKLATQTINEIWGALSPTVRSQVLGLQRAWIRKKQADCDIAASEASTDPVVRETTRLRCDTNMTRERAAELRSLLNY